MQDRLSSVTKTLLNPKDSPPNNHPQMQATASRHAARTARGDGGMSIPNDMSRLWLGGRFRSSTILQDRTSRAFQKNQGMPKNSRESRNSCKLSGGGLGTEGMMTNCTKQRGLGTNTKRSKIAFAVTYIPLIFAPLGTR